ncbi:MAG: choice-of-anchor U domain-containing protein [Candidatus Saccharimonas sp.]
MVKVREAVRGTLLLAMTTIIVLATFVAVRSETAEASAPLAARLLSEPYATTGVRVAISNLGSQMRGLTNDGTNVYALNQSGNIYSVPLSSINQTPGGATQSIVGTAHTVGWGVGGAPSMPPLDTLSISYSSGCIFITNNTNVEGNIDLYCIDTSDYSVTEIEVPGAHPLPQGNYYVTSSLIDFPDGRIGKVSEYEKQSDYYYTSVLRTYTVTGAGKDATLAFSEDYVMKDEGVVYNDTPGWARDEHGIATDGTYLYRIQWNSIVPNTKVWALASGGTEAEVVYEGSYTQPFSNMHYLSHNHLANNYLMGHFWGNEFFITTAADPGPGPGNPLNPVFGPITRTALGYTVQITNYDASFNWSSFVTTGNVSVSNTGLVTVTGLTPEQFATIIISTTKAGVPDGSADTVGQALGLDMNGDGEEDSEQPYVAVITSPITSKTVVLEVDQECTLDTASIRSSSELGDDSGYSYPLGLVDFTASCGELGFTTTVTQYFYEPPNANYMLRKLVGNGYRTVDDATLTRTTLHGTDILKVVYAVTDGGPLDDDGEENGVIVDPAGPAIRRDDLAVTGIERSTILLGAIPLILLGGTLLLVLDRHRRTYR